MNKTKTERIGKILRETKETQIEVEINIDGSGISEVDTGICSIR